MGISAALSGGVKGLMGGMVTGNPTAALAGAAAGALGGALSGGGGGQQPAIPVAADPTSVLQAMQAPYTQGSYADLAEGRAIGQAQTPYLSLQQQQAETQQQDLQDLLMRAQGQGLLSTEQGLAQQRALQAGAMGQAASARGAYNPTLQAAAQRQASMIPAQMQAGMRANEGAERMAALQAYNQGAGAMRQQGQSAMQAWSARQAMERQRQLEQEQRRRAMLELQENSRLNEMGNRASVEAIRTGIAGRGAAWDASMGNDPFQDENVQQQQDYADLAADRITKTEGA